MEKLLPIRWPVSGLVEAWAFSDQPENSAREFQNVRTQAPITKRLTGSKRSGMSRYVSAVMKAVDAKVAEIVSFVVDNRQITYSALSTETSTWERLTPAASAVFNLKTDRQGNTYALDGKASIVKYSADGEKLWQLALPAEDPNHVVRALAVDDGDLVYAGISASGEQAKAKLWAFEQLPDNKTQQRWEIAPKAYIEDMKVFEGCLYTCQNESDRKRAWVRIYEFITSPTPELKKEWRVPFPVNSIAIKKDGSVVVACEPGEDTTNYFRATDPKYPAMAVDSIDWTPFQLDEHSQRIWSWYVADDIDQTDVASDLADGVEILRWRDRSRQARHLSADLINGNQGPRLARDATPGGHAGVRFNKADAAEPHQRLVSDVNSSFSKSTAEEQRTMIPAYTDSMFAMWIVARLSKDGITEGRAIFHADRDNNSASAPSHVIFINANSTNGVTTPPTFSPGDVYWFTGETVLSGGSGTAAGSILHASFDDKPNTSDPNPGQLAIICLVSDGQVTGSTQQSLFQINGFPVDLFQGKPQYTTDQTRLNYTFSGVTLPFLGDIFEIVVLDRKSRETASENVLTYDALEQSSPGGPQTINEMTVMTGYLAHKYGMQFNLPNSVNTHPHPFGRTGSVPDQVAGPPISAGTAANAAQALANKAFGCVVKYAPDGRIKWTANQMELIGGLRSGGYGYAVAVNSDGNVYSYGPQATGTGSDDNANIRLIIDQGDDFSIQVADGAWSINLPNETFPTTTPRIDVDEFDNLYVPTNNISDLEGVLKVYDKTGTELHSHKIVNITGVEGLNCVAVDRRIPDYRTDITPKRAEHVICGMGPDTPALGGDDISLAKVRLVLSTQVSGSVRSLIALAVSGGDIVTFDTASVSTPTGGSGALDSTARYIQGTTLFKKAYFTDGRQYKQYDPVEDEVTEWKCLSAGGMPSRCSLLETWRGRLVLARSADEPHGWFMSKKDDPDNFDFFPPTPTEIDAVEGANSLAGLCPDIINTVVPYSEDILIFGGDHSIWALIGDPAAGGRLELVSDITGMAFGRPWCKDPNGVLYFIGSRGGLFHWAGGGKPERISVLKIEKQLQDIDFAAFYVRLVWNFQDEGIHIIQCPFGAGGTQVSHWFWEQKTQGFALDIFGTSTFTNIQPTAIHVIDGDDFDDRVLLIGGEDGFVRRWDANARSDDVRPDDSTPHAINSKVTIFPIAPSTEYAGGSETQYKGLTVVLGNTESGCRYELFSADEPEDLGTSKVSGLLGPGRNPPKWHGVTGAYCGLRLQNAAPEERFTFERAYIYASPAGMVRPRAAH